MASTTGSMRAEETKVEEGPVHRDSAFADGTFHQSQLSLDAVKQGFFARPDAAVAEAVNKDADTVEFTEAEEVRRVLPTRSSSDSTCLYP